MVGVKCYEVVFSFVFFYLGLGWYFVLGELLWLVRVEVFLRDGRGRVGFFWEGIFCLVFVRLFFDFLRIFFGF